jgi:hypothetical protein
VQADVAGAHVPVPVHTLQSTPSCDESFADTAIRLANVGDDAWALLAGSAVGKYGTNWMKATGVTVACADADCAGGTVSDAAEVAVIITVGKSDHSASAAAVKVVV